MSGTFREASGFTNDVSTWSKVFSEPHESQGGAVGMVLGDRYAVLGGYGRIRSWAGTASVVAKNIGLELCARSLA